MFPPAPHLKLIKSSFKTAKIINYQQNINYAGGEQQSGPVLHAPYCAVKWLISGILDIFGG